MNDLETLQGLEKLELLIHAGIERGEHLVQQACRVDEVKQLLQAMQQQQASLTAATEQAELLSAQVLDLETTMALLHNNRQTLEKQYHTLARQAGDLQPKHPSGLDTNRGDRSSHTAA